METIVCSWEGRCSYKGSLVYDGKQFRNECLMKNIHDLPCKQAIKVFTEPDYDRMS